MKHRSASMFACMLLALGCGGGGDGPSVTEADSAPPGRADGGPPPPIMSCAPVCAARLSECGAPPGGDLCAQLCDYLTSDGEIECLSTSTCEVLETAFVRGDIPCDGEVDPEVDGGGPGPIDGGTDPDPECDAPRCEGNRLTTCEVRDGIPITTTITCTVGCSDGACTDAPSEITIVAHFGSGTDPIHVLDEDTGRLTSYVGLSGAPEFTPDPPSLPSIFGTGGSIESPSPGDCEIAPSMTLNRTQVAVTLTGTDTLPSTACSDFVEEVASSGLTVVVRDAPYDFPVEGTVDVTIEFRP
jgi:hypothetical protein